VIDRARIAAGATAAFVVAGAGAIALVAIGLFFTVGQPFGTINDLAAIFMIGTLQPVMLAHYELGGVVPLWPARASLAAATLAVAGWALIQIAFILGPLGVDILGFGSINVDVAATGAWAAQAVLQGVIGLWIAGASLLAGRWLPASVRTLGIVAGVGVVVMAGGILRGGYVDPFTNLGGVGYQIVLPIWALLLGRVFRARLTELNAPSAPAREPVAA
jgi:hypothetical protein